MQSRRQVIRTKKKHQLDILYLAKGIQEVMIRYSMNEINLGKLRQFTILGLLIIVIW